MAKDLRLHFRYPPAWDRLGEFVARLQAVLAYYDRRYGIGLAFATGSSQSAAALATTVNVGGCTTAPSAQASTLFRTLAPVAMGDSDVAVLFANALSGGPRWGCAQCPVGWRGVIVSASAPVLVLAHGALAHLFLGTGHDPSASNLMYRDPANATLDPPSLDPDQVAILAAGEWALPSLVQPAAVRAIDVPAPTRTKRRPAVVTPRPRHAKKKPKPRTLKPRKRAAAPSTRDVAEKHPSTREPGKTRRSTGTSDKTK